MKNSSNSALLPPKPTGLRKWVYALPRHLYALHLGWLFDHKFLLLTHRGRKTGLIRRTVIAVMLYDRRKQESMVLAGYGKDSDWYRNLQAHPALEIQTGFCRYRPTQRFLTEEEVYALLARFAHRIRFALRVASYTAFDGSEQQLRALAKVIGGVAFSPQAEVPRLITSHNDGHN